MVKNLLKQGICVSSTMVIGINQGDKYPLEMFTRKRANKVILSSINSLFFTFAYHKI